MLRLAIPIAPGGRPPHDPVLLFKILVIQAQHGLSDDKAEFLVNDRLSFIRFLGLGLSDQVPNAKTLWMFRERPTRVGYQRREDHTLTLRPPFAALSPLGSVAASKCRPYPAVGCGTTEASASCPPRMQD